MNLHAPPTPDELAVAARHYDRIIDRGKTLQSRRRAVAVVAAALFIALAAGLPIAWLSGDHHTTVKVISPAPAATAPATSAPHTSTTAATTSSSAPVLATTTPAKAAAYRVAIGRLQAFLDAWQRNGYTVASKQFMVPARQCGAGCNATGLRSGKVLSYQPFSWESNNHFTLLVAFDLHLLSTLSPLNEGKNGGFITFSRPNTQAQYLLEWNSGP